MKNDLGICTVNVNGLRDPTSRKKPQTICHIFQQAKDDIFFLVDTHLDKHLEHNLTDNWAGTITCAHNQHGTNAGLAVLSKETCQQDLLEADPHGRYIIVQVVCQSTIFLCVGIYAPPSSTTQSAAQARKSFFTELSQKIQHHKREQHNIVVLGDFNMTEESTIDKESINNNQECSIHTLSLKRLHDIEDIWRVQHPTEHEYTFTSTAGYRTRIDRVYTSRGIRQTATQTNIQPFCHSDHASVHVRICASGVDHGLGMWNQTLLQIKQYVDTIVTHIDEWKSKKELYPDHLQWWDECKAAIKRLSIKFAKNRRKRENRRLHSLHKRLANAARKLVDPHLIEYLTSEVRKIEEERAGIHIVKAKVHWVEEGERCTKYFQILSKTRTNPQKRHHHQHSAER